MHVISAFIQIYEMRHVFVLSMKDLFFFISRAGRYCLVVLKVELPNIAHKRKSQLKGVCGYYCYFFKISGINQLFRLEVNASVWVTNTTQMSANSLRSATSLDVSR